MVAQALPGSGASGSGRADQFAIQADRSDDSCSGRAQNPTAAMDLTRYLRDVPDFPKPGILFKDITPLLASPPAMQHAIERLAGIAWGRVDRVAGIESRGFLFGVPLAMKLGKPFVPIRKPGKLPWKTNRVEYVLEYGKDAVEIHQDAIARGEHVLIVDDLLATGGTMWAACQLVESCGGQVAGCAFVIDLAFLGGKKRLGSHRVESLIRFD
jgi:adenine phosphoribosyltransferase